jgi:hypothetical protein
MTVRLRKDAQREARRAELGRHVRTLAAAGVLLVAVAGNDTEQAVLPEGGVGTLDWDALGSDGEQRLGRLVAKLKPSTPRAIDIDPERTKTRPLSDAAVERIAGDADAIAQQADMPDEVRREAAALAEAVRMKRRTMTPVETARISDAARAGQPQPGGWIEVGGRQRQPGLNHPRDYWTPEQMGEAVSLIDTLTDGRLVAAAKARRIAALAARLRPPKPLPRRPLVGSPGSVEIPGAVIDQLTQAGQPAPGKDGEDGAVLVGFSAATLATWCVVMASFDRERSLGRGSYAVDADGPVLNLRSPGDLFPVGHARSDDPVKIEAGRSLNTLEKHGWVTLRRAGQWWIRPGRKMVSYYSDRGLLVPGTPEPEASEE